MDQVAEAWLVYRLTGSALLLGTVAFASQIPVFLLAPIGGAMADRLDRRKILICTQSAMMLLTFMLAWSMPLISPPGSLLLSIWSRAPIW